MKKLRITITLAIAAIALFAFTGCPSDITKRGATPIDNIASYDIASYDDAALLAVMSDNEGVFCPDSLQEIGDGLLADSQYNYTIQFPAKWFFYSSVELKEALVNDSRMYSQDPAAYGLSDMEALTIEENVSNPDNLNYVRAAVAKKKNHKRSKYYEPDPFVTIGYSRFESSFADAAMQEWTRNYARMLLGVAGADSSYIGELEQISINGMDAYHFPLRINSPEETTASGFRFEYTYLIAISDDVFAIYVIEFSDTKADDRNKIDEADLVKFHKAMLTIVRTG